MQSQVIKSKIESLFPCQVGFVKARVFTELQEHLRYSQERDYDSGLIHESIAERINPFLILPTAKTIIVMGFPYQAHDEHLGHTTHALSRSSWGEDYHIVIQDQLKLVANWLHETYGATAVALVDHHMLHDKHMAQLAGLGQFGKNTLLINPQYGSFFFIGSLVTDLELGEYEYSNESAQDICGQCNRCIKACPTGAISEERYLNSKRCLSYLTQSKDLIPDELIGKMQKFTFGCDFCQLACPYNQRPETDIFYRFKPLGIEKIQVKDLYHLSNKAFKQKYGMLAGSFRGKNVLLRNALVISANTNNREDLSVISKIDAQGNIYLQQAIEYAKAKLGDS